MVVWLLASGAGGRWLPRRDGEPEGLPRAGAGLRAVPQVKGIGGYMSKAVACYWVK